VPAHAGARGVLSPRASRLAILLAIGACAPAAAPEAPPLRVATSSVTASAPAPEAPADAGTATAPPTPLNDATTAAIREAARDAIARAEVPGAVVVVARSSGVVFREAFGLRRKVPAPEPMTVDTVFDLASLTKAIATAPSVHLLVEQGKLDLTAPVARYLPGFAKQGKEAVTVEQLLLHTSGLPADDALSDYRGARDAAFAKIDGLALTAPPGTRLDYSDVGYIVLGEIVEKLSGGSLAAFAKEHLFAPLGMDDTAFNPPAGLAARAAPTELRDGVMIEGTVHDPRAAGLGGIAGHAGLFSTADDLARFARMLLAKGRARDTQILAAATVDRMTAPRALPGGGVRSLGWDVRTGFSGARGELDGYGHTGFTGTSIWIDPSLDVAVIVLTSRLHPDGKGDPRRVRRAIATAVARGIRGEKAGAPAAIVKVQTGVDVLERDGFARLKGRRVALVTNASGVDARGTSTLDLLRAAPGVSLVALFSPEHGLRTGDDGPVGDGTDARTGLPVYSLYGKRQRPTDAQLAGIDTIVFDLADAGTRCFTYETTLGYLLEAAAAHRIRVVVLDRPNPLGGVAVEGPVLDASLTSFVGYHPVPVRHGMTMGELARLWNAERHIGADLQVVAMEGWRRGDLFDATGVAWINPSPNLRGLDEALAYPGLAILETTNVSVGRGTARPFEQVGAPWMDGARVAAALNALHLPGVAFTATSFTPTSSTFAGRRCEGVALHVDDRVSFQPVRTGVAVALTLLRLHAASWKPKAMGVLLGHPQTLAAILRGDGLDAIVSSWEPELAAFRARRAPFLLYTP
jgi:uncharacterized protein YbbC (DUF1343 family)/CubicO group peptidase (beta-lactamase class C family)